MTPRVSVPIPAKRPFRILALPLARLPRPAASGSGSTTPAQPTSSDGTAPPTRPKNPLMLFHVSQPDPSPETGPPSLTKRALNKANETWLKLGEKDKKSVSYWFYKKGEGLMDKIEYEEWALKNVTEDQGVKIAKKGKDGANEVQQRIEIALLKPTFEDQPLPTLVPKLHRFLIHRIPYHRKMMMRSLIATPLTWPFAIIPIIPNFPFFYVLWRAWSHYKAWRGALYLENLLKLGMIVEKPSKELDAVYQSRGVTVALEGEENIAPDETFSEGVKLGKASGKGSVENSSGADGLASQAKGETTGAPDGTATPAEMVFDGRKGASGDSKPTIDPSPTHPSLMLAPAQVPLLAKTFDFRPHEVIDVHRAVEQAEMRAQAIDKANAAAGGGEAKGSDPKWRGNLHR